MSNLTTLNTQKLDYEDTYVESHNTAFLDSSLLSKLTKPDHKIFVPVTVKAIDTWWIFNTAEGDKFLTNLSDSPNMAFFETEAVQTIIQFLWQDQKKQIFKYIFIPFFFYFALFIFSTFLFEGSEIRLVSDEKEADRA